MLHQAVLTSRSKLSSHCYLLSRLHTRSARVLHHPDIWCEGGAQVKTAPLHTHQGP